MAKYLRKTHFLDGTIKEEVDDRPDLTDDLYSLNTKGIQNIRVVEWIRITENSEDVQESN